MRILIGTILFLNAINFAQDINEQFRYAESVFNSGKYFEAVTEFKRLQFFDSDRVYNTKANYYLGLSYKKGGFYGEAIRCLMNPLAEIEDPDSIFRLKVEVVKCNILRRTIHRAMTLIDEITATITDSIKLNELDILRGFSYAFSDEWEKASEYFYKSGIKSLGDISKRASEEWYSETKAKILSVFIPGAGQIYTGNYLNGLLSLSWNALSLYLTIDSFVDERIFDGVVTGNFLWLRFYSGNIYNAGKFARENNEEISQKSLRKMQEFSEYSIH